MVYINKKKGIYKDGLSQKRKKEKSGTEIYINKKKRIFVYFFLCLNFFCFILYMPSSFHFDFFLYSFC